MAGAASDAPLVDLLLAATGENAQVAATAVATSGSAYEAPDGAELTAEKEALIREWLAAPHTPWQVLLERFGD